MVEYIPGFISGVIIMVGYTLMKGRKPTVLESPPTFTNECDHIWGNWEVANRGNTYANGNTKIPAGKFVYQERSCTMCGKLDVDKQVF